MVPGDVLVALGELKQRLVQRFGPRVRAVVLFGSHARGEARPDSDVDVLVLVEGLTGRERSAIYGMGAEVWMETGVDVAPVVFSTEEYAELERLERLLPQDIAREGVAI
jgi:predicted nucleotidyltransferase